MTVRIAMWSGPRNISTAMMRSFGARPDTRVVDEPFYAAFLAATGLDHPMRAEVLASQPTSWRDVAASLDAARPDDKPIIYEKHMTHHMLPDFGLDLMASRRNAFLIRDPASVVASYAAKRAEPALSDIGVERQLELFEREAGRLGRPPPVIDGADVLANPRGALSALCAALDIPWIDAMLSWPPGRRDTDGVWAPAWYSAAEASTGFGPPVAAAATLEPALQRIADAARPCYDAMAKWKLAV